MEPLSLSLGALVAAVIAKATDRTASNLVDAGGHRLQQVASALRSRLSSVDDDDALKQALQLVVGPRPGPTDVALLATAIDEAAAREQPEFRRTLEQLVYEAQAPLRPANFVAQEASGVQVVQVANASNVTISYGPTRPPDGRTPGE
jgi:hypothetical protein